jgi:hypothetical protein
MPQRFLHNSFKHFVPCEHCGGEVDVEVEGHYYDESFVVDSVKNLHTGKEMKLTDSQRELIEEAGDLKYAEIAAENLRHQHAVDHNYLEVS